MKQFLIILALIFSGFSVQAQQLGLEMHYSVNRTFGHSAVNTYYGGGIGANVLFRDTSIFNIKTGLELNYFHTWDGSIYTSQMWTRKDLHYRYLVVSIPAFVRFTFGKRVKVFFEGGAYLGFSPTGKVRFTNVSYGSYPGDPTTTTEGSDFYSTGVSISPAGGIGVRFPLSERLDLFLKPEFAFVKNKLLGGQSNGYGSGYGGDYDFNNRYTYLRLCAGLHLKTRL